jgi:hypothetical protein
MSMITGIRFGSFVPEPQPHGPVGVPTVYQPAPTDPVIPVHIQPVRSNG